MRKAISAFLCLLMLTGILTGCGNSPINGGAPGDGEKLSIVTTIFPEYDWVRNILGENAAHADVMMLLDSGVDLHSYQPTADDMIRISACDLFIYVGGESDGWVEDALAEATNKDMVVINLLGVLGDTVKEEEMVEGMEAEEHHHEHEEGEEHEHEEGEEHEHEHEEGEEHEHEHEEGEKHEHEHEEGGEYDEHVWLSLKNAAALCNAIKDALAKLDPDHAGDYTANTAAYIEELNALDALYRSAADAASVKTVLFADRFPFRYLVDDYGLSYYAAFAGCSAESEASFETIAFLADKVDALGLPCILTIEGMNHTIAETVVSATSAKSAEILTMDSMQSITAKDVENGATYISIMEKNLEVLKQALR